MPLFLTSKGVNHLWHMEDGRDLVSKRVLTDVNHVLYGLDRSWNDLVWRPSWYHYAYTAYSTRNYSYMTIDSLDASKRFSIDFWLDASNWDLPTYTVCTKDIMRIYDSSGVQNNVHTSILMQVSVDLPTGFNMILSIRNTDGSVYTSTLVNFLPGAVFKHWTITRDSDSTVSWYLNGVLVETISISPTYLIDTYKMYIGDYASSGWTNLNTEVCGTNISEIRMSSGLKFNQAFSPIYPPYYM